MRALKARGKKGFNYWLMSFRDREQSSCWLRPNVSKNTHTHTFQNRYKKSLESKVKGKNIAQKNSKTKQKGKKRTQNSNSRRWELGNWWGVLFWAERVFMALFLRPIFFSKKEALNYTKGKERGAIFLFHFMLEPANIVRKGTSGKSETNQTTHSHTTYVSSSGGLASFCSHTHTHTVYPPSRCSNSSNSRPKEEYANFMFFHKFSCITIEGNWNIFQPPGTC